MASTRTGHSIDRPQPMGESKRPSPDGGSKRRYRSRKGTMEVRGRGHRGEFEAIRTPLTTSTSGGKPTSKDSGIPGAGPREVNSGIRTQQEEAGGWSQADTRATHAAVQLRGRMGETGETDPEMVRNMAEITKSQERLQKSHSPGCTEIRTLPKKILRMDGMRSGRGSIHPQTTWIR